jgi:hypothetical protein
LGIAEGSFEELLADYEDYLRQRKLLMYPKASREVAEFRQLGYRLSALSNLSGLGDLREKLKLPGSQVDAANLMMTLLHIETTYWINRLKR